MYVLGGNCSEERFSPTCLPRQAPPSKDFSDVPAGAVTSAVKAQEFLKGGVGGNFLQEVSLPQCDEYIHPEDDAEASPTGDGRSDPGRLADTHRPIRSGRNS